MLVYFVIISKRKDSFQTVYTSPCLLTQHIQQTCYQAPLLLFLNSHLNSLLSITTPQAFVISCLNWYSYLPFLPILYTNTKMIILTCKFDDVTPTLKTHQWLPTMYNLKYKVLGMSFKAFNDLAPAQFLWLHIFTHPHIRPTTLATPKTLCNSSKWLFIPSPHIYALPSSFQKAPYSVLQMAYPYSSDTIKKLHPPESLLVSHGFPTRMD